MALQALQAPLFSYKQASHRGGGTWDMYSSKQMGHATSCSWLSSPEMTMPAACRLALSPCTPRSTVVKMVRAAMEYGTTCGCQHMQSCAKLMVCLRG